MSGKSIGTMNSNELRNWATGLEMALAKEWVNMKESSRDEIEALGEIRRAAQDALMFLMSKARKDPVEQEVVRNLDVALEKLEIIRRQDARKEAVRILHRQQ